LAAAAGRQLRVGGRPISGIEPTTELVTDGIYRYLRHPLYISLLLLVVGVWLKNVSWASTAWGVGSGVAVWVTARREEAELGAQFGEAYRAYRARTKGYVPWVW
jgi:protein-S-isoprenylcysteine O-methyltransferase Ste14